MSHSNATTHYDLPQFIGTDKPGWLTDVNQAMSDIDEGIYQAASAAQGAQTSADSANSTVQTVNADLQNAKNQLDATTTVANQAQAKNTTQDGQISQNSVNINNINARLGNNDISGIGDGTVTGAITAIEQSGGSGTLADEVTASGSNAVKSSGIFNFVNEQTGGLQFAQDAGGNWGYKIGGADPVIPFSGSLTKVRSSNTTSSATKDFWSYTKESEDEHYVQFSCFVSAPNGINFSTGLGDKLLTNSGSIQNGQLAMFTFMADVRDIPVGEGFTVSSTNNITSTTRGYFCVWK